MRIFHNILNELETPDDQGRDWYGWASNQMSHAFLGVLVALVFASAPIAMTSVIALAKEGADLFRSPTKRTVIDAAQDAVFWLFGAWLVTSGEHMPIVAMLMLFALLCGVIPRVRAAMKAGAP